MASNKKSVIRVLHVDDDPSLQEITKLMLLDLDSSFEIDHACCVDEALRKLSTSNYDVVVSDYEMPQKDGLQFLKELRKGKNETPFVLFTGKGREDVAVMALNLGADGYFNKQGNPETVYGELAHGIKQEADRAKAKLALEESEKRYRTIMEQAADSIIVHDKNRRIIDANAMASRKLGYTRDELLSMSITDISSTATEDAMEDLWPKIIAGQTITLEANHKTKSGNIVPVEVTLGPLVVDKEIQVIGLVRDITERKKAEEEMRMSELILQNSSDSIITTDLQGKIISWNKGATEIFGYSTKEALGENIAKIVKQVERERIAPTQLETMREGKVFAGEWEDIRKDGSSVWLLLTTTLLLNSKNEPVGMVGFGKDISKHKQIEADLLKSKFLLSETEKTGKIGGWEFDVNTLAQSWTEETFRILEIDLSQGEPIVPKGIDFINHPYRSMANEAIKRAIEHGESYDQKWEITTMKGNKRWVHAVAKANRENNKIRSISGSFQDITESKHTEEKLRQSEERFWQLFSSMPSGMAVYEAVDDGEDFVFRDYNAAAEKIDRISRDNVVGKRVTQTFPGVKGFGLLKVFQRVWRTGQMEYFPAALYKDKRDPGSWRENWVYKLPNGNIVAVFNDITEHKKTEAEVLWLASFPTLNPNPIVEVDLEGNISYVNSATESIFPDLKKEGLGHPFFSGWQQVVAAFKDGKQQTFSRDIEIGDVWCNQQIQFVHETRHVRIYATNITAAKKAEQETLQTKHLLEAHITNSPLAVIEFDSQYRVTRWSSEAENVFGWSADEVFGKAINEIPWVYKKDAKIVEELSMNMVEGKRPRNMNVNRNCRKDGSVIWCEWYNSAIYDKQGKMVSVLSNVLDITKRKKVEAELREQELKYYNIFNNSEVGMFRTGLDGSEILDINDKYLSILGINREDIKGRASVSFWADPLERQEVVRLLKANGQAKDFECKLLNKRHEIIQCLTSVRLYSEQGILEGSIIDITERKKAEEELKMAANIFDLATDSIFVHDTEGNIVNFNEAAYKLRGYSKEEMAKMNIRDLDAPETAALIESRMKLLLEAGNAVFEGVQMRKDKTLLTVELHVRIIDLDGKKLVLSVARDISERKRAEESLRDSEEKFRNLAEESPNMIFMNRRGRVVYANKKCEEILGYTREDFYSPDFNFVSLCAPEYVEVMKSAYATNMRNEVVSPYEFVLVTRGGKRINVIIAVKLIEYAKERVMLGIITDITERKKTEEELSRMFDQLVLVNEKLGVVGKLTRHDVRNKLSAVTGYAYLLKKKHADQADVVESLGKMEQTIKEVEAIFDFAKMYEQLGVEELTYIDVGKAVDEASALFPDLIVKVNNDCHGLAVLGDSFLRQLFCNLIDNTRKYGKKTTTINVYYEKAESGELRLIYEDDGVGISAENKLKLFHEGFSTGGSTGFGLYLIKKMVKVYGWKIQEVGEPEKGAKFVLTIPRISQNGKRTFKLPNKTTPFSKPCRELPQQRKNNTTKQ